MHLSITPILPRYSAAVLADWQKCVITTTQTNLLLVRRPSEVSHCSFFPPRDHGSIREVPLPHNTPVPPSAALGVDLRGHTHQGRVREEGASG